MNTLLASKEHIFNIKRKVAMPSDGSMYSHCRIYPFDPNDQTISIVMTSSNRSEQAYFTLKTISNSAYKNVQVIIVDDSDRDPICVAELDSRHFSFCIDLIRINRSDKNWHNPLVNYNIGFKFIQGGKVVIQNSEVCHIGDVLQFVSEQMTENNYYVFDVKSSLNYDTNKQLYEKDTNTIAIYNEPLFYNWYQGKENNRKLHFLTALSRHTFDKIKEFSYDYAMGSWYDDDDFLLKIMAAKINIINIFHNEYNVGGIHLFHGISTDSWDKGVEMNNVLFIKKAHIYNSTGDYINVTDNAEDFETIYNALFNG